MGEEVNRRNFLKAAAIAAGPAVISARGANEKINVGWIGVGTRGNLGLLWLNQAAKDDVQITAICDTYEGYIQRAKDQMQTVWGTTPKFFKDYRELLADKSIDAVWIMTPEHLHHDMAIAALNAGKNVYLEKPLAHTIEEGWEIIDVWKKSGKVCQVGTQNRSSLLYKKAKELIQQGMIGNVHYARAFWYRNSTSDNPSWRYVVPAESTAQNTDWNRFLGQAPKRPFDKRRYFQWRLYWDYSGGISTDLLVHQTDIINFMLDKTTPKSCMASGGVYRWVAKDDDRDAPDTFSAIYEYPGNFQVNYSSYLGNSVEGYGEHIYGDEGTIAVENRQDLFFTPDPLTGVRFNSEVAKQEAARIKGRKPIRLTRTELKQPDDGVLYHFRNFIAAIKGTEQVIAPPTVGQQAAIGGHLATLSYKNGKKILWDDAKRKYSFT